MNSSSLCYDLYLIYCRARLSDLRFPEISDSFDDRNNIPPPSHRVMVFKARFERESVLNKIENAYAGLPYYSKGSFSELLQWLHRFDVT